MPKKVHDLVHKLLADPDFYPNKSEKEQEAIAWAIAYSKNKDKRKKKKTSSNMSSVVKASKNLESSSNYFEADMITNSLIDFINDNSNNTK